MAFKPHSTAVLGLRGGRLLVAPVDRYAQHSRRRSFLAITHAASSTRKPQLANSGREQGGDDFTLGAHRANRCALPAQSHRLSGRATGTLAELRHRGRAVPAPDRDELVRPGFGGVGQSDAGTDNLSLPDSRTLERWVDRAARGQAASCGKESVEPQPTTHHGTADRGRTVAGHIAASGNEGPHPALAVGQD